ncbi:MAG: flagellar hook-associated protein FlgL [Gammaproteobacteria bacterium]|nr:flagellar hook-associated protein FlgL [Gammaproteobacteria bacterium]MDG2119287.1 flagellar hook-associated protein FlgL [Gammaproteobacteria bacterium]
MKISTSQYYRTMNDLMTDQQGQISKLQSQLASGVKNVTPSTDVKATTTSLKLNDIISKQDDYLSNLKNLDVGYIEEETAMSGMVEMIRKMQDIAIQAPSGTYSNSEREIFAIEVEGYLNDIRGLANTKDYNGHYLFSGSNVTTMPFTKNGAGATVYNGNQTEIKLEIDQGHKLPLNISGDKLAGVITKADGTGNKVDMFGVMTDFVTALETNNTTNIQRAATELDAVAKNLAKNLTDNGLRQRVVEERQMIAEDKKLVYEGLLSGARDVDYATSITELSSHMLALEAAQSTFAKVSQLTLFSYIR